LGARATVGAVLFEELVGELGVVEAGGEGDVEVADVDVDAVVDEGAGTQVAELLIRV